MRHVPLAIAPKALVEPEVVATSPCRIKSPVPVCCGFDSEGLAAKRPNATEAATEADGRNKAQKAQTVGNRTF